MSPCRLGHSAYPGTFVLGCVLLYCVATHARAFWNSRHHLASGKIPHSRHHVAFVHVSDAPVMSPAATAKGEADLDTLATLNLRLYCERHGYKYIRLVVPSVPDRSGVWLKPMYISTVIREFAITVLMDFDVLLRNDDIPLFDLLNQLGFKEDTLILQALDPVDEAKDPPNSVIWADGSRVQQANTGFMVFRQHDRVLDILQTWTRCPDDIEGCSFSKHGSFRDQLAWNQFIRPNLTNTELVLAPCETANGYGFGAYPECRGEIVSHWWLSKSELVDLLRAKLLNHYVTQDIINIDAWVID
ncbi:hypothetical protein ABBQ32_008745 [Trebouxia sp. C0010 RCD-2024]